MAANRLAECVKCGRVRVAHGRGLCFRCHSRPSVRGQFAPLKARGLGGDRTGPAPLPVEATGAAPGTVEKVAVMHARARRGEQLFHPGDAKDMSAAGVLQLLKHMGAELAGKGDAA